MRSRRSAPLLLAVLTAGALLATPASVLRSQTPAASGRSSAAWVLNGGAWHSDLTGVTGALRFELPMSSGGRWLFVPGLTYSHYNFGTPTKIDVFVPEALIHYQLSRGPFRPYLGAGAGLSVINVIHTFDPVLTFTSGLRIDLTPEWGARLEGDVRSFGFEAATLGWSVGIARRF